MSVNAGVSFAKRSHPSTMVPSMRCDHVLKNAADDAVVKSQTTFGLPTEGEPLALDFGAVPDGRYYVTSKRMATNGSFYEPEAVSEEFDVVNVQDVDVPATISAVVS